MKIIVIPGDGIGPEIVAATERVLRAVSDRFALGLQYEHHKVGLSQLEKIGTTFPEGLLERCRTADGIVLGPVSHGQYPPRAQGGINPSAELRIQLDLFANIRPSRTRPGMPHYGRTPMDLVIVRENTEGFYADRNMHVGIGEFMPTPDVALSVRKITAKGSERIARSAFALAMKRRRKVTAVHKQNVMRISDQLFLDNVRRVASEHPAVEYEEQLVDSMAALLVRDAARYDVVVTTNMFGDILSDEAAGLVGGLGMAPGLCIGESRQAMAQATHGSAPDIAGKGIANPYAMIESTRMLLEWLGRDRGVPAAVAASKDIERATTKALADPASRTGDIRGTGTTASMTRAIVEAL